MPVVLSGTDDPFMIVRNLAGEVSMLCPPDAGQKLPREVARHLGLRVLFHVYPDCRTVGELAERLLEEETAVGQGG